MIDQYNPESMAEWNEAFPDHAAARDAAIRWAREVLSIDFVCLDTETTGLDYDDEAVSVGIVARSGAVLLDTLLCHEKPSNPLALAVHGIEWEMTRAAPRIAEIYETLVDLLGGAPVTGYNAGFDHRIIHQTLDRYGLYSIHWSYSSDVMQRFAEFYGEWSDFHQSYTWKKLTFAASFLGLSVAGAHGAVADALMTLRVVEAMARAQLSTEGAIEYVANDGDYDWDDEPDPGVK